MTCFLPIKRRKKERGKGEEPAKLWLPSESDLCASRHGKTGKREEGKKKRNVPLVSALRVTFEEEDSCLTFYLSTRHRTAGKGKKERKSFPYLPTIFQSWVAGGGRKGREREKNGTAVLNVR